MQAPIGSHGLPCTRRNTTSPSHRIPRKFGLSIRRDTACSHGASPGHVGPLVFSPGLLRDSLSSRGISSDTLAFLYRRLPTASFLALSKPIIVRRSMAVRTGFSVRIPRKPSRSIQNHTACIELVHGSSGPLKPPLPYCAPGFHAKRCHMCICSCIPHKAQVALSTCSARLLRFMSTGVARKSRALTGSHPSTLALATITRTLTLTNSTPKTLPAMPYGPSTTM